MRNKFKLLIAMIMLVAIVHAQPSDSLGTKKNIVNRSIELLTGVSFGNNTFYEIGVSRNSFKVLGYHPFSSAYFASTEFKFGNKFIAGPKIGAWTAGGSGSMAMGLNMIYYTDFDKGSLVFRPEIGFGLDNFKIVYGFNTILTKHQLEGINRHLCSFIICFRIKKLGDKLL